MITMAAMAQLRSTLFVSRSLIPEESESAEIEQILRSGMARNCRLGVKGGLIFTHRNFAEVLEGPASALEELLDRIGHDPRHCDMRVIDSRPIDRCTYGGWAMAYHGPASYVSRRIAPLLLGPDPIAARELRAFMHAMLTQQ